MGGQFEYEQLQYPKQEIRLLELLPSHHHLGRLRPACRIFHISRNTAPPYLALSYVWGHERKKRIILVNKRPFWATQNLFDAMMGLREPKSVIIWIDAVCINQKDNEEKASQVRLMGDLYHKAATVIAWLGPPADNSDLVFDYLNELGAQSETCRLHEGLIVCVQIWRVIGSASLYENDLAKVALMSLLYGAFWQVPHNALAHILLSISGWKPSELVMPIEGLKCLFRRAWWGRVWVLQEITNPEYAYFACGTKKISRQRFQAAFNAYYALWNILSSMMARKQLLTAYQRELILISSHRVHIMLSMPHVHRIEKFPLAALLRATCVPGVRLLQEHGFQHLDSTDPRDKIFALLGLAEDRRELETLLVFPDYRKSKVDVYTTTMAALLRQGHTSMLSFCQFSGRPSTLPSWVPDWSTPMPEILQDFEPDHLTLYPKFNASGSERHSEAIIWKADQSVEISLCAHIYDKVLKVGRVARVPATGTCFLPELWLYKILLLTYDATNIYPNFHRRLQAVVRASHAAIGWGENGFLQKLDRFHDSLPFFTELIKTNMHRNIKRDLQRFLTSGKVRKMLKLHLPTPDRLLSDFMRISSGRTPFVTDRGHLGLASQHVRSGDIVAVLSGVQVPFILRKSKDDKYKIIGEAYVDSIMDGEAVAKSRWQRISVV